MTIGTSLGQYYEDDFERVRQQVAPIMPKEVPPTMPVSDTEKPADAFKIERGYHVPLVATALMDEQGKQYGMAIDHRIPPNPEYEQFVALHEAAELPHMQNLIAAGMSNQDAYHEAHDKIATPTETAAVRAYATRTGRDPDQYLEDYKQHWRDAAAIASEPTDKPRHPDAHTTRYGLDESETGQKFAMNDNFEEHSTEGPQMITHQPLQMDALHSIMTGTHPGASVYKGPNIAKPVNENIPVEKRLEDFRNTHPAGKPISEGQRKTLDEYEAKYSKDPMQIETPDPDFSTGPFQPSRSMFEKLIDLERDHPEAFKYARARYKQQGGKDWETFQKYDQWKELGTLQDELTKLKARQNIKLVPKE